MLSRAAIVAWKEFIQIRRDWRTLAVVLVLPVLMLVLYGYAINFDLRHVALGVRDDDRTPESRRLIVAFGRGESFAVAAWLDSPAAAARALDAGAVRAVLAIPRGYAADIAAGRTAAVQLLVDGADSTSARRQHQLRRRLRATGTGSVRLSRHEPPAAHGERHAAVRAGARARG